MRDVYSESSAEVPAAEGGWAGGRAISSPAVQVGPGAYRGCNGHLLNKQRSGKGVSF